ncbi:MAG: hypothetical protein IKI31_06295 [Treponema sp.]|nr:hypothetical protein [Treponema sp.]
MTFKARNTMLLSLFLLSLSFLIIYAAILLFNITENRLVIPTFQEDIFSHIFLANRYQFWAVVASLFVFLIYVPITVFFLFLEFEKTHSNEVIFFAFFLIGCLAETIRLCIPLFNLWHSFSLVSIIPARAILFARILSPLSLLFLTIFSEPEHRQLVERNIVILTVISIMAAIIFPLNTMVILPSFCMQCGDEKLYFTIRILMLLLAIAAIFVKSNHIGSDYKNALYFTILSIGYFLCTQSFSFVMLAISAVFFIAGTILYLTNLHKQYLWK